MKEIENFLDSITDLTYIPNEILSKYYVRIYTEESNFYRELNQSLREGKNNEFLSYIKVIYEGIRLKALPYSEVNPLYRGTHLPDKEIEKMIKFKNKGEVDDLPGE